MKIFDPALPEGVGAHATGHMVQAINTTIAYKTKPDDEVVHFAIESLMSLVGRLEAENRKRMAEIKQLRERLADGGAGLAEADSG